MFTSESLLLTPIITFEKRASVLSKSSSQLELTKVACLAKVPDSFGGWFSWTGVPNISVLGNVSRVEGRLLPAGEYSQYAISKDSFVLALDNSWHWTFSSGNNHRTCNILSRIVATISRLRWCCRSSQLRRFLGWASTTVHRSRRDWNDHQLGNSRGRCRICSCIRLVEAVKRKPIEDHVQLNLRVTFTPGSDDR